MDLTGVFYCDNFIIDLVKNCFTFKIYYISVTIILSIGNIISINIWRHVEQDRFGWVGSEGR